MLDEIDEFKTPSLYISDIIALKAHNLFLVSAYKPDPDDALAYRDAKFMIYKYKRDCHFKRIKILNIAPFR
jgi:hypothetical protein